MEKMKILKVEKFCLKVFLLFFGTQDERHLCFYEKGSKVTEMFLEVFNHEMFSSRIVSRG